MDVAVCITGLQRSLLEPFVVGSYREHIEEALARSGWRMDTHLAIVLPHASNRSRLRAAFMAEYKPRTIRMVNLHSSERIATAPTCTRISMSATRENRRGELSVLRQFNAIGECFAAVQGFEMLQRHGKLYDWLVRTRTDLVYFAPIPIAKLAAAAAGTAVVPDGSSHVYVPSGGMTVDASYRCKARTTLFGLSCRALFSCSLTLAVCMHRLAALYTGMNDMAFLCPRALCRPYFQLLELWRSPFCNASKSPAPQMAQPAPQDGIFAPSAGAPHGQHAEPKVPFVLPRPPRAPYGTRGLMSAQWYAFARYVPRPALPCQERQPAEACCGMIREVRWPFGLRRVGRVGNFDCFHRLVQRVPVVSRSLNSSRVHSRDCWEAEGAERAGRPYCRTGECGARLWKWRHDRSVETQL